ncbi:VWA domain-containing protein [Peptoniphilus sp. BV3AC2]|uniref:vWA domain-containing protein n=1 Tax=Peptoniphilus sp. BV3AC2 TaxID=1111133 RepID=UPI0003B91758|nr:vWA domain-containing protein [Peptoniphilus sp. BV3AC2]ERT64730.1 von Willebrand factor type A domain protein [Peptoniphilus sp. BV3AC2]
MKRTKRFISLFLAIIMLLGAVVFSPTPVQAQGQGTEPPQWVKDQITQDLDTDLKDPGSVKLYTPIIEEDETYANRWHVKALIAARDTARTTDIVLVMDTSGSMKGNRMTSAIAAAHSFVNTVLQDGSQNMRVAIVPFAGEVGTETDFTDNITTLHAAINNMNAKGGTFTQGGIYKARQMLEASKANNKYMLVMSDGVPTYSYEIQDPDTYATDYVNDVAYDRGFLGNELRASGYATNANVAESDFTYNDYNKTGNGSYMYYLYQQGSLWSYNLFYNHGNSAVAEAGFAKNAGIHVYSIGLQTDADGSDVLRRAASKDSFIEVTNVADLEPEFKKIANNILKTVNDAKVHTEFNKGFEIPSDVPDNELKHSPGAKIITDTDGKKKWYMHSVSTVYDTDDSTLKYEYIEYVIDLNNDILDANGNAPGTVDLLKSISVEYIDVNGKIQTLLPASLPNPVTPTIITVKKVIKNNEGGAAVDNAQREFEFIVKSSDKSENYPSIKLRPGQTRLLERIKKASTYTIYESKIGKAYELKK